MLKKMCVIKACWRFQKSKMMGYIPVQRRTDWAMIVQIPALVSPFISCVAAFCAQNVFASFKIYIIFPSHWWENYSITLSKYCESTRFCLNFIWPKFSKLHFRRSGFHFFCLGVGVLAYPRPLYKRVQYLHDGQKWVFFLPLGSLETQRSRWNIPNMTKLGRNIVLENPLVVAVVLYFWLTAWHLKWRWNLVPKFGIIYLS